MTHILHRQIGGDLPVAAGGKGIEIVDTAGKRYIDASGGAAVSCLGHGHPAVTAALHEQLDKLAYAHTGFFTTDVAERLADRLIADAPQGISHAYLVSGGSEAIEAALKMARQYFTERGQKQRRHVIARRQSYHGNTLGALAAGGNEWRRAPFSPLLIETHHIDPCFAYRFQEPGETEEAYAERAAGALDAKIHELGPDTVMAFVAETVVGATAGAVPPAKGYFKRIREICDRHGVLLILDEVMCGMGRTGTLHACEQEGIAPDLMTIAKGLGGGYAADRRRAARPAHLRLVRQGQRLLPARPYLHGPSTGLRGGTGGAGDDPARRSSGQRPHHGRPAAPPAGRALRQSSACGDIRGRGLFQAVELVEDRSTKAPFDPAKKLHAKVKKAAMARGLMVYPMGGTIDGVRGDHVLLAPPFIVTADQIGEIVDRLGSAIDDALG